MTTPALDEEEVDAASTPGAGADEAGTGVELQGASGAGEGTVTNTLEQCLLEVPKTLFLGASTNKVDSAYDHSRAYLSAANADYITPGLQHTDATLCRMHSKTEKCVSDHVLDSFVREKGHCRLCFATAVMEHGLDCADLRRVVHIGSPTCVELLLQGIGRAGRREGQKVYSVVYWNGTDFTQRPVNMDMQRYCENKTVCRRKFINNLLL